MKAIFLASGSSSRMDPISDKTLLPFCGKPLLVHLLENAQKGGIKEFVVVVNKTNKSAIKEVLRGYKINAEITLQKNLNEGMAGGVKDGLDLINDDKPVLILGGNDYVEVGAYKEVLKSLKEFDGALLGKTMEEYFPGGYLSLNKDSSIKSIIEKPGEGKEPSSMVNIVVHVFKESQYLKNALKKVKKDAQDDGYEKALDYLFKDKKIKCVEYNGVWQAIKYPWHILDMQEILLQKELGKKKKSIHKNVLIADTARIRGNNIIIEEGVQINDNVVIQGPCYIGKNCVIGNNALIRNTHVGHNSTIGYNTEIARSYLSYNISTHISYIGDSIVDNDVNFGAFSTTANLRFDKKDIQVKIKEARISSKREKFGSIVGAGAQIGIHCMLMPGSKIKKDEFIMSGSLKK